MLRYANGVKGYKLRSIKPWMNKVVIDRDVIFYEERMPFLETLNKNDKHVKIAYRVAEESVEVPQFDCTSIKPEDKKESQNEALTEDTDLRIYAG